MNLYGFVGNDGVDWVDAFGTKSLYPDAANRYAFDINGRTKYGHEAFYLQFDPKSCQLSVNLYLRLSLSRDYIFKDSSGRPVAANKASAATMEKARMEEVKKEIQKGADRWSYNATYYCPCSKTCPEIQIVFKVHFDPSKKWETDVVISQKGTPNQGDFNDSYPGNTLEEVAAHEIGHYLGNPDEYGTISNVVSWRDGSGNSKEQPYGLFLKHTYPKENHVDEKTGMPDAGIMNNAKAMPELSHYWRVLEKASEQFPALDRCSVGSTENSWIAPQRHRPN